MDPLELSDSNTTRTNEDLRTILTNTTKAIEAAANAKFTEENIKTIDGQLQLWAKQAENWEGQRENVRRQIEAQIEQWAQENMFAGKKLDLEEKKAIADTILRGIEIAQGIAKVTGKVMAK